MIRALKLYLRVIANNAVILGLKIRYEWEYTDRWLTDQKIERLEKKIVALRQRAIDLGLAKWLADYDAECEKLDKKMDNAA